MHADEKYTKEKIYYVLYVRYNNIYVQPAVTRSHKTFCQSCNHFLVHLLVMHSYMRALTYYSQTRTHVSGVMFSEHKAHNLYIYNTLRLIISDSTCLSVILIKYDFIWFCESNM